MNSPALSGRVVSLHLHPSEPGTALQKVETIEVVEGKGIAGEPRYFGRMSRRTGKPSRRQVSLIEREQIAEHAASLGLETIPPGAVRSNIETEGINLVSLVGNEIEIGEAVLLLYEPRDPCAKMDAICQGLRELMLNSRQGAMAEVVKSGTIKVGDAIVVRKLAGI
jgi:MOSC domain-containing protein YiiM